MKICELKPGDIAIVITKNKNFYKDIIVITPTDEVLTLGENRYWDSKATECINEDVILINKEIKQLQQMIFKGDEDENE